MGLLINGGPRDDVRRVLHVATEMREREDIGELREERGILNDDDKEEQLLNKRLCRGEMLVDEGEFVAKNGNFDEMLELIIVAKHFQQTRIGHGVAMLALGKSGAEAIEFGFGQMLVEIAPESFDGHLHLRDAEQAAFHHFALDVGEMGMEVLHIGGEFHFTVHPEGFVHLIHEIHRFGILERLEIDAFIKNTHEK